MATSTTAKALKIGDKFICRYDVSAVVIDFFEDSIVYIIDGHNVVQIQKISEVV